MTWTTHLYGNKKTGSQKVQGLIPQLSQRIGVIKQLENWCPENYWEILALGSSPRNYCAVSSYAAMSGALMTWMSPPEGSRHSQRKTPDASKSFRIKCWELSWRTQIAILQQGNYWTKLKSSQSTRLGHSKPYKQFSRLELKKSLNICFKDCNCEPQKKIKKIFPHRMLNTIQVDYNMTLSRSGLIFRGTKLWNQLPVELRSEQCRKVFKKQLNAWVLEQVTIKPP